MAKLYLANVKPFKEIEIELSNKKKVTVGFLLSKEEELKEFNEEISSSATKGIEISEKIKSFEGKENMSSEELEEFSSSLKELIEIDGDIIEKVISKAKEKILYFKNVPTISWDEETFEEKESTILLIKKDSPEMAQILEQIFSSEEEKRNLVQAFNEIRVIDFKGECLKNL